MFAKNIKFHFNAHRVIEYIGKFIGSTLSKTQKLIKEIKSVDKVKEIIKKWQIDIKEEPFRIKA